MTLDSASPNLARGWARRRWLFPVGKEGLRGHQSLTLSADLQWRIVGKVLWSTAERDSLVAPSLFLDHSKIKNFLRILGVNEHPAHSFQQ